MRAWRARALLAGPVAVAAVASASVAFASAVSHPEEARCYGAASRDVIHPCHNGKLRLQVSPTPIQAVLRPPATCVILSAIDLVHPCRFGYSSRSSRDDIALVGDSHAGHWRAAVRYVAQQRRWRGTSLTRSGCAFSTAVRDLPEPARSRCRAWNREVVAWFGRHPEVHTVFVSAYALLDVAVPAGASQLAARVRGYSEAWRLLPATVSRIIVLRDTTLRPLGTLDCIDAAIAARRPAGPTCAAPRSAVLKPDGEVVAATHLHSPRVRVADFTRYMCSARLCQPVVGGALVNKDETHMTTAFSLSLGPVMLRRVAHLGPYRGEHRPRRTPKGATGPTGATGG